MNALFDLQGKTALVTGSGQGLGFAIAQGLGEAGAKIVLNGRNEKKLFQAVTLLQEKGVEVYAAVFDVTDEKTAAREISRLQTEVDPIDILVNNAGIQHREPVEKLDLAAWKQVIDVNLTGCFVVTKQVLPGMISRNAGKIINIGSVMSEVGRPTILPYTTSKGGVKMFTKGLAVEVGKHNIQVNAIGPGYFATEMTTALIEDETFNDWVCSRTPAGRWGMPQELVGTAVFLASSASNYVNGQVVYVDGGLLAGI